MVEPVRAGACQQHAFATVGNTRARTSPGLRRVIHAAGRWPSAEGQFRVFDALATPDKQAGDRNFEFPVHGGLLGPAGMPADVVQKINADANKALQSPAFLDQLKQNAMIPLGGSPTEFARFLATDLKRWSKVVEAGKMQAE